MAAPSACQPFSAASTKFTTLRLSSTIDDLNLTRNRDLLMNLDTLQSIQRAGTALHEAQTMLAEEVKRQAAQVTDVLTADPFNIESDSQFESWKAVARMAQSLAAMEEQMKKVYYAAADLLGGKRLAQPQLLALAGQSNHDVIDE